MLMITVPKTELFDEATSEFLYTKEQTLQLEHSLVSLHKWEARHHKPFLSREPRTADESVDYIRCMTITQNVDPNVYIAINKEIIDRVNDYIDDSMTATTFPQEQRKSATRDVITAEIIYYWMIQYRIPFECRKWHLNQLLTLIRVCEAKSQAPKKMPRDEMLAWRRAQNAKRRKQWNTKG